MERKALQKALNHIQHVQQNCIRLAFALMEENAANEPLALQLIQNGLKHDHSKLQGIEAKYLGNFEPEKPPEFALALEQHQTTNRHHPEAWPSIHDMPTVYVYEMACDLAARSAELGTCVWDYIHNQHMKRFAYTKDCAVYRRMEYALNLLLEKWS